ncbi:MAG: hypothetical protein WBP56_07350 [Polyangia bacterium]
MGQDGGECGASPGQDHVDDCREDVVFFADEAGSWQVGVDWDKVLPPWFRVLSATAEPQECVRRITDLLNHHCKHKSEKMLAVANETATPDQRKAFPEARPGNGRN